MVHRVASPRLLAVNNSGMKAFTWALKGLAVKCQGLGLEGRERVTSSCVWQMPSVRKQTHPPEFLCLSRCGQGWGNCRDIETAESGHGES